MTSKKQSHSVVPTAASSNLEIQSHPGFTSVNHHNAVIITHHTQSPMAAYFQHSKYQGPELAAHKPISMTSTLLTQ